MSTRTVKLPEGGELTITLDARWFLLSKKDRDIVFAVVDAIKAIVEPIALGAAAESEGK